VALYLRDEQTALHKMINEIEDPAATLTYQGILKKPILDMTSEEQEAYYQFVALTIRERLFAIGQPLVYKKKGKVVAEHADGHVEIIR
jgi:hypothetical protein